MKNWQSYMSPKIKRAVTSFISAKDFICSVHDKPESEYEGERMSIYGMQLVSQYLFREKIFLRFIVLLTALGIDAGRFFCHSRNLRKYLHSC